MIVKNSDGDFPNHAQEQLIQQVILNDWKHKRIIHIKDEIDSNTEFLVNHMLDDLFECDNLKNLDMVQREPICIFISSAGGDAFSALSIISKIQSLRERGYIVYTYAFGMCMSAALQIFLFGTKRFCQKHTRFMVHQPSGFEVGYTSSESARRFAKDLDDLWTRLKKQIIEQTNVSSEFLSKITASDENYFFWPEEAIELGVTDEII